MNEGTEKFAISGNLGTLSIEKLKVSLHWFRLDGCNGESSIYSVFCVTIISAQFLTISSVYSTLQFQSTFKIPLDSLLGVYLLCHFEGKCVSYQFILFKQLVKDAGIGIVLIVLLFLLLLNK